MDPSSDGRLPRLSFGGRVSYPSGVPVSFRVPQFEGPLDLLLQLVEQEKLDISQVTLAAVADQFLEYVNGHPGIAIEELADFLVVAARLVQLKARLLLPDVEATEDDGPDLAEQLRRYRKFVEASKAIAARWTSAPQCVARQRPAAATVAMFVPPPEATAPALRDLMWRVIARLEPLKRLPQVQAERLVSVQERVAALFAHVRSRTSARLKDVLGDAPSRADAVATFLALLELVRRGYVRASQPTAFDDIRFEPHPAAPAEAPMADAYL